MATGQLSDLVRQGWEALAAGELDRLAGMYAENMVFVLPGQDDVLEGRAAFRDALDGIAQALPPGFDIAEIRYFEGDGEVVNIIRWKSDKLPGGSQCAVLFRFEGDKVAEERWFVDTEQWKAAF